MSAEERAGLFAEEVAFAYARNEPVLRQVCADIVPGAFLGILGVNGCGKSTLLACLDGMLKPKAGRILLDGQPLESVSRNERARKIALVAQHNHATRLTVYDALLLGRTPHTKGAPTPEDLSVVDAVMSEMGLSRYALRYVDELSGGEYQKVVIARAFVQQTDVLLLDEPTNNLDMANQVEVMRLVRTAVDERGLAAAAVMHDINLALAYCDQLMFVREGLVYATGNPSIVTPELIRDVYGVKADVIEHHGRRVVVPQ